MRYHRIYVGIKNIATHRGPRGYRASQRETYQALCIPSGMSDWRVCDTSYMIQSKGLHVHVYAGGDADG